MANPNLDTLDAVIREIASRHGVAVNKDDPILFLTINEFLAKQSDQAQQEALKKFHEELEATTFRWNREAKEKADRILSVALSEAETCTEKILNDVAKTIASKAAKEIDVAMKPIVNLIHNTHQVAIMNLIAAFLSLTGIVIVMWLIFH